MFLKRQTPWFITALAATTIALGITWVITRETTVGWSSLGALVLLLAVPISVPGGTAKEDLVPFGKIAGLAVIVLILGYIFFLLMMACWWFEMRQVSAASVRSGCGS